MASGERGQRQGRRRGRDWMQLALDPDATPLPHYKQRYDHNSTTPG